MVGVYAEFARNIAAMPVVVGRKSRLESFAGAESTYTIESMMGDRRALQVSSLLDCSCIQPFDRCCYAQCISVDSLAASS